jgi:hypothetical protein
MVAGAGDDGRGAGGGHQRGDRIGDQRQGERLVIYVCCGHFVILHICPQMFGSKWRATRDAPHLLVGRGCEGHSQDKVSTQCFTRRRIH